MHYFEAISDKDCQKLFYNNKTINSLEKITIIVLYNQIRSILLYQQHLPSLLILQD